MAGMGQKTYLSTRICTSSVLRRSTSLQSEVVVTRRTTESKLLRDALFGLRAFASRLSNHVPHLVLEVRPPPHQRCAGQNEFELHEQELALASVQLSSAALVLLLEACALRCSVSRSCSDLSSCSVESRGVPPCAVADSDIWSRPNTTSDECWFGACASKRARIDIQ